MFNFNGIEDFTFDYASYTSANPVYLPRTTVCQQVPCSTEQIVYTSDNDVSTAVMPSITDVKVIKEKVVIVSFSDGTQEKSVCAEGDVFSNEVGASEKKKQEEKEKIRAEKRARKEAHDKESKKKRDNRKYLIDICAEALKKAIADTQEDKLV